MPVSSPASLSESILGHESQSTRALRARDRTIALADLASGSSLGGRLAELRDRVVLVRTTDQLAAALILAEADGIARRLVLCPPDLDPAHLPFVVATAGVDAIATDQPVDAMRELGVECVVRCEREIRAASVERAPHHETEWILFTSGTTGIPKMVVHNLTTLAGAIQPGGRLGGPVVWATFYDVRRYGGLQILLRALLGGGSLLMAAPDEAASDFLSRAQAHGVTHITGTPSHWRRAIMSGAVRHVTPEYARLSGEIADQGILDALRAAFPEAKLGHAFASTEAGVAFEVTDGRAGFPASFLERRDTGVDLRVDDDTLRIRSGRTARGYLGRDDESLLDPEGFVDTGDVVELRDDRYHFVGRRGGIINVGGLKIHPEEVEAVINRHPRVRMSLVRARRNPITGAIVAADVVLAAESDAAGAAAAREQVRMELIEVCRQTLAAHKVPAAIRFVPSLEVTPSGKLVRGNA